MDGKYYIVTVKTDGTLEKHVYTSPFLDRSDVNKLMNNRLSEIVRVKPHPELGFAFLCDDMGKVDQMPENIIGTLLYGNPQDWISGDIHIGTLILPEPDAEPDFFALNETQLEVLYRMLLPF